MSQVFIPKGWKLKKLEEFCKINPPKSEIKDLDDKTLVSFIPMKYVDDEKGIIAKRDDRKLGEVRKGYTYFRNDDVIFAKITPCMENGKAAIGRELTNGIGFASTEFHVLRPNHEAIPEWIYYFVRNVSFRNEAKTHFTGSAGQQRVPVDFLKSYEIPLPNIETQKKIVQKLDYVLGQHDEKKNILLELQKKKNKNLELLSDRAIGNIISKLMSLNSAPISWQIRKMEDVCEDIQPGFAEGKKDVKGGIIHLRMNNIGINFELNFELIRTIEANTDQLRRYQLKQGDVIFNNTNSSKLVGKSAIFNDSKICLYSNHLTRLRVNRNLILPEWLLFYLRARWLNGDFERMCNKWINQASVNNSKIQILEIPVPELEIQRRIVESISNISMNIAKIKTLSQNISIQIENNTEYFENLQMKILDYAFSGKLVN